MSHAPYSVCYAGSNPLYPCTPQTCCLAQGSVQYLPSIAGNGIYLAIFIVLLLLQVFLGVRYRTWGFLAGMSMGTTLEVLGYAGRLWMNHAIFDQNAFLFYLIPITIGPAFLTGAIYLCLARLVVAYGVQFSRFQPRTYTLTFMTFDFFALLLQAIGGALTSTAGSQANAQVGVNIMIAGLSWQVISLVCFMALCCEFAWRLKHSTLQRTPEFSHVRASFKFRAFLWALPIATVTIFVRCVFRVAELQGGFSGKIANNEALFMVFEGPMIFIAVGALTVFHPGLAFGDAWKATNWSLRKKTGDSSTAVNEDGYEGKLAGASPPTEENII